MQFIRLVQEDPFYPGKSEVMVSVGQIVCIYPIYYDVNAKGEKFRAYVDKPGQQELLEGKMRDFIVVDSLGRQYDTSFASKEGKELIERLWREAV